MGLATPILRRCKQGRSQRERELHTERTDNTTNTLGALLLHACDCIHCSIISRQHSRGLLNMSAPSPEEYLAPDFDSTSLKVS